MSAYPIQDIRALFPALCRIHNGKPAVYLDGPGGSQVVATAITAMTNYMRRGVANVHGKFPSSEETERLIASAREALADLLGCAPDGIAFGANATSNMFAVSRALARGWTRDDEIVVSEMDHHSHVDTWKVAAEDKGAKVRALQVDPTSLTLDLARLEETITPKTRLVAVGYASNAIGAINDIKRIAARCREVGALLSVDAVHIAPHTAIDIGHRRGLPLLFRLQVLRGAYRHRRDPQAHLRRPRYLPAASRTRIRPRQAGNRDAKPRGHSFHRTRRGIHRRARRRGDAPGTPRLGIRAHRAP